MSVPAINNPIGPANKNPETIKDIANGGKFNDISILDLSLIHI